jgi:predicted nucleotidyltransferase
MDISSMSTRPENALARTLASKALADVVTYFVLFPEAAPHFRALQRVTGVASRSLQHELARLLELGMVRREKDGRLVRYRAVAGHPRWSVLRSMVREFADPGELLRIAVSHVPGIDAAFIYGSCARGDMHAESDIDVFVLGERLEDMDARYALGEVTLETSALLNHEVNVSRYTRETLEGTRTKGFLRSVLAGPKIWLVGDDTHLKPGMYA